MPLSPSTRLGPYEIISVIGAGGMGEVYRARDTRLDRTVAIKILPEHLSRNPQFHKRFEREAKAISSLSHPHICPLYDVGHHDGIDYLVMEHLEGETLDQRLKKGPLPPERALEYAIQIADALEMAHRHGVIHRDLKPGNIMLTDSGAKLLDFGLAKVQKAVGPDEETMTTALTAQAAIVGTIPYMSPEQLEGREVDARSDVFAFGAVLYEMLTGRRAFQGQSTVSIIAAVTRDEPKPVRELVKGVPLELEHIVVRCLRKARNERYASASEVERQLQDCRALTSSGGINLGTLLRKSRRPRVAIPVLLVLLLFAIFSAWWIQRSFKARWARTQALPAIERLIGQEKRGEAYALAVQAERYIPDDPILGKFWPEISWMASIRTTPPGAAVFRRNFGDREGTWKLVGRSPIQKYRLPLVDSQWRFELKGFSAVERATMVVGGTYVMPSTSTSVTMDREAKTPPGMIHQTDGVTISYDPANLQNEAATLAGLPGFEDLPAILLGDYWIDRYEVSNKQFKEFMDKGGYKKQEYWKHGFRKDGRSLSWTDAMASFHDKTGRAGPATWEQGEFPRGQDDFPVSGVSWYEAAAYAEFAGKSLPTIYHWTTAASPWASASMVPASNFGERGLARVGSFHGMSWSGAYDMAGNVKEWCWNEAGSGKRYTMGGAWDEPLYMFNDADARAPLERSANLGFRCAKYGSAGAAGMEFDVKPPFGESWLLRPRISSIRLLTLSAMLSNSARKPPE